MGDEEPVSQQPADEEQDQTTGQTTEEPGTDQEGADSPDTTETTETTDTPGGITPESHYPGG
jgi:hypothetical protein